MLQNDLKIEHSKKTFVSPELTIHGDVEAITLATGARSHLDAGFPTDTPFDQLTFS